MALIHEVLSRGVKYFLYQFTMCKQAVRHTPGRSLRFSIVVWMLLARPCQAGPGSQVRHWGWQVDRCSPWCNLTYQPVDLKINNRLIGVTLNKKMGVTLKKNQIDLFFNTTASPPKKTLKTPGILGGWISNLDANPRGFHGSLVYWPTNLILSKINFKLMDRYFRYTKSSIPWILQDWTTTMYHSW